MRYGAWTAGQPYACVTSFMALSLALESFQSCACGASIRADQAWTSLCVRRAGKTAKEVFQMVPDDLSRILPQASRCVEE